MNYTEPYPASGTAEYITQILIKVLGSVLVVYLGRVYSTVAMKVHEKKSPCLHVETVARMPSDAPVAFYF